jgi:chromosome segregation ATPase
MDTRRAARMCVWSTQDAALDTQRVRALAEHVGRRHTTTQAIFVSHRKEMIDAAATLVGTYTLDGGAQTVALRFGEPQA